MAWLQALLPNERERALADLKVVQVEVGELLCRVGRPVTYWFGVVDGLLKMSNDTAMGVPITFTGIAARRLVRRRHGDQARGLPLQHPGAAQERGRRA